MPTGLPTKHVQVEEQKQEDDEDKAPNLKTMSPPVTMHPTSPTAVVDTKLYTMIERKDPSLLAQMGDAKGLHEKFGTNEDGGLSSSQVLKNRSDFGENVLPDSEKITFWGLIWEALKDLMMRLLMVAAIISIIFGMTLEDPKTGRVDREEGWIEGTAILISVALVVLVTATNDYQKAKKFAEMEAVQSKKDVEVIRGGAKVSVDVSELVVGDILHVAAGWLPSRLLMISPPPHHWAYIKQEDP